MKAEEISGRAAQSDCEQAVIGGHQIHKRRR